MAKLPEPQGFLFGDQSDTARILLVDAASSTGQFIREILTDLHFPVADAHSAEEAKEWLHRDDFAVILIGATSEEFNGYETARLIRRDDRLRQIPIIFLTTAEPEPAEIEAVYALGAVDFIGTFLSPVVVRAKLANLVTLFQEKQRANREARQWRVLVHGTQDYAIFMLDPDGRILTWNSGAELLKGYQAGEIIGQHFSRFYPQEAIDRGWPEYELKVAAEVGRFEDEGWRVRKDGSQFWANVVITALRDERHHLQGFSKVTRDLTERKRAAENALRLAEEAAARRQALQERERLRVTLASIGDGVISTDLHGRVTFLNPVAEELIGWESAEATGKALEDVFQIINEETRRPVENPALRALNDGKIVGLANHTILIARDGTERPIDDSAAPIRTAEGEITGSVLVFRDITERKRTEAAIADRVRLLAVNAAIGAALVQGDHLPAMLKSCCESLVMHLEGALARIWTFDETNQVLELKASAGLESRPVASSSRIPLGTGKIGQIAQDRQPLVTTVGKHESVGKNDSGGENGCGEEWAGSEDMAAFAGYPLIVDQRLIGVIAMFAHRQITQATQDALAAVANEVAIGIERKLGQQRLVEQREWLSVTLASIGDAVITTDDGGRVTYLNGVARELTGWTSEEAIGCPLQMVFAILNEETREAVENPVEKVLREGGIVGLGNHTVLISRDGQERPIDDSAAPIRDSSGKLIGVVLIFREVTEQRTAERQLRESEARKSAVVETALDAIITMDGDGNVVEFNPAAEQTFGYRRDELIGRELAEFIIPPSWREGHRRGLERYLETGQNRVLGRRLELTAQRSDGTEFPVELAITRISQEGPPLFTAYARDITERRRAEIYRDARLGVTHALAVAATPDDAAAGVLKAVCLNLGWDVGFLWTLDDTESSLVCRASWHHPDTTESAFENASRNGRFSKGQGLPGRIWETLQPSWFLDIAGDPNFPRGDSVSSTTLLTAFACPLLVGERFRGVIEFFTSRAQQPDPSLLEMVGTVAGAIGQFLERKRAEEELREQTSNAETLLRISRQLGQDLDLLRLVQVVTDEGTMLCGAELGAFFYNVTGEAESYTLFTVSGAPREAFAQFPMPRNTELFAPTFRGEGIVRLSDVTQDPRYGKNSPHFGMPDGHWPVKSYLAVPVVSRRGNVLGALFFGHAEAGIFTAQHERLLGGIAGQAAIAIDNAQMYQRTQATAERLNLALTAANLGDWRWNTETDLVTFSERAAGIVGIPAGPHLTWTRMQDLISPDDRERIRREVERVIEAHVQYDVEYRLNRPDGSQIWVGVLGRAIYDAQDNVIGMHGVIQNITERKQLEESLKASEARFRGLMEQAPFSVQVFSPDGRPLQVNHAWEELWGLKLEYMADYNILEDPQLEKNGVLPLVRQAFSGEPTYIPAIKYDPRETAPNQEWSGDPVRWVTAVAYPLKDDAGILREVVLVHDDVTARRRAESAVRESEEKLRLMADTIPQLAWMAEPNGEISWFNRRWYEYTGGTPSEMLGWGWRSVPDPELLPHVIQQWKQSLATGEPFDMVFPLRGRDGVLRPFLTRINPLQNSEGRILYWFGTSTDITELRQARQALTESEERLRLALVAGRMGVWDWNIRTSDLKWSDSLEPLHGLAPGTFGGTFEHFQSLIYPEDRDIVQNAIRDALESGGEFYVEFRNVWPNGGIHWIAGSGKVINGEDGRPLRMIGVGMDVTPQKRAEQTARFLADASAALAVVVDFDSTLQKVASLAVPHFADWATVDLLDEQGNLRRVAVAHVDSNKVRFAHDLHRRFPPNPNVPGGVWKILRSGQAELVSEISEEKLTQSIHDPELLEIIRQLGLKSYIGVPLTVRGNTTGVLTFIVAESGHCYDQTDLAVAQDLANRAAIAAENMQLYRELQEADRRKDEFLATLAHELRNPLAPIRNGLQVMRLAGGGGELVEEARQMMDRQLRQMVRLVDDLLDVSRITRNKLELRKERVSLASIIHSAIETSRPLIEQFGHTFSVTLPSVPVELNADPVRLAQVFSNLLNNAAKYTEPGGKIVLSAELENHEAVIRVSDNGLGIPAEAIPRLFQMFSQIDFNMERAQGGLGIGLTLVRRLSEMHDGSVSVKSDGPGQGSEFTVRIPVPRASPQDATSLTPGLASQLRRKVRILVVDDNRDAATSLGMMLRLMGNEVRIADDGLAAISAAEEFRPELIILDIGLPKLNGYDVCRRIRAAPWSQGVVVAALTGWGQEEDRRRSQSAGFDHHLVKPVDVNVLTQLLAQVDR